MFGGSAAGILQPKLDCQHETLMHLINSQVKDFSFPREIVGVGESTNIKLNVQIQNKQCLHVNLMDFCFRLAMSRARLSCFVQSPLT